MSQNNATKKRLALNSANRNPQYEALEPLQNPINDARAIEELLDELGFETILSTDRDARRRGRHVSASSHPAAIAAGVGQSSVG